MKNLIIGLSFVAFTLIVGLASFYLYKKSEVDSLITKLDGQIQNSIALESDIFTNCMGGKEQSENNISVCEENTKRQLSILITPLLTEKQKLENLSITEIFRY